MTRPPQPSEPVAPVDRFRRCPNGGTTYRTPRPSTEDNVTETDKDAEIGRLNTLIEDLATEMHTDEVSASLAETITSTDYELRDTDLTVLDEFNDVSHAVFWQGRNPGSRIFERPVTTTIVRGQWTEVER